MQEETVIAKISFEHLQKYSPSLIHCLSANDSRLILRLV